MAPTLANCYILSNQFHDCFQPIKFIAVGRILHHLSKSLDVQCILIFPVNF